MIADKSIKGEGYEKTPPHKKTGVFHARIERVDITPTARPPGDPFRAVHPWWDGHSN